MAAACAIWSAHARRRASPRRQPPQRPLRLWSGWSARIAATAVALATGVVAVALATAMSAAVPVARAARVVVALVALAAAALVAPGAVARAVRAVARVGSEMTRE